MIGLTAKLSSAARSGEGCPGAHFRPPESYIFLASPSLFFEEFVSFRDGTSGAEDHLCHTWSRNHYHNALAQNLAMISAVQYRADQ